MDSTPQFTRRPRHTDESALDLLRAAVLGDPALAERLGKIESPDQFVQSLRMVFGLNEATAAVLERCFQVGTIPFDLDDLPPPQWTIARSISTDAAPEFEWIWIGDKRLTEPFYEDTVRKYRNRPLNRLVRFRTTLQVLVEEVAKHDRRSPDGLIFHMSRCGSTLLAQMLAQSPDNIVLSEPEPFDAVVRWASTEPSSVGSAALQSVAHALGRNGRGKPRRLFLKLDAWHTLALPLLVSAFPTTPWIFLYRNPADVLASHANRPGAHMVPGVLPPELLGMEGVAPASNDEHGALVLERICEAALGYSKLGRGLLLNYSELRSEIPECALRHFGLELGAGEAAMIESVTAYHSKTGQPFGRPSSIGADGPESLSVPSHLLAMFRQLEEARKNLP